MKKLWVIIGFALAAGLVLLGIWTASTQRQVREERYEEAMTAREARDYETALQILKELPATGWGDVDISATKKQVEEESRAWQEQQLLQQLESSAQEDFEGRARILMDLKNLRPDNEDYRDRFTVARDLLREEQQRERTEAEVEKYMEKIERELQGLAEFNVAGYLDSKDSIIICAALFSAWASMVEEGNKKPLDSGQKAKVRQLKRKVVQVQRVAFPKLRDAYGPAIRRSLWEHDIEVRTFGGGFRVIEFVGGVFAANRNIKEFQTGVSDILHQMRFRQARYKWFRGDDEYTYYDMSSLDDSELVIWVGGSRYRTVS